VLLVWLQATDAGLTFDSHTPAATFANEQFSQIFFKTSDCLRADKGKCFPDTSPWWVAKRLVMKS
jgi:hypothetical protein